jgi:glycosyltransferase involved in cell wall biosynthesis
VSAAYLLPWKDHLVGELRDAGVEATCLRARSDLDPRWIARLRSLVRDRRIQLVHAHSPVAAALARAALGRRAAFITTEHNTWDRYRPATRRLNAFTFGHQQAVIAVSREVARSIGRRSGPPVHVIPNGIDADSIRALALTREAARDELGLPPGVPVVGTIGGVTAKKGHVHLVRATASLLARVPDARAVIVGLPIDPEPVRRAIGEAGLEGRVLLAGYHPAAARLLPAFDVFALPSLHEGMPVSLLEAMALGIPVVASRVGGVPEVVTDGADGLLVPPADDGALAAALADVLLDAGRRRAFGEAGPATAERFSLTASVRRTEAVYDEALARRNR